MDARAITIGVEATAEELQAWSRAAALGRCEELGSWIRLALNGAAAHDGRAAVLMEKPPPARPAVLAKETAPARRLRLRPRRKTCLYCGLPLPKPQATGRPRLYCDARGWGAFPARRCRKRAAAARRQARVESTGDARDT